jgi:DNA-binding CsgD family transcriptional regulator/mannose-6-phosphate isomerase-like protein (cupin superfamily)
MRYTYPHTIDSGHGERLTFLGTVQTPDGERLDVTNAVAPGAGPPMHVHHYKEEALTVEQGRIGYQRLGEPARFAGPGETVTFKPGEPHKYWNAGDVELRCRGYVRPPDSVEISSPNCSTRPGAVEAAARTCSTRHIWVRCDVDDRLGIEADAVEPPRPLSGLHPARFPERRLAPRAVEREDRRAAMITDGLAAARDAFARQDWKRAYAGLSAADAARAQVSASDLECLAIAAYMLGKDEVSADLWSRAHTEWLRLHDPKRAARCTFWLVLDLLTRNEAAQAAGWIARAQHLLDRQPGDCAERGLLFAIVARTHVRRGDLDGAHEAASHAIRLARHFADDAELQVFSRLSLAQVMARRGEGAAAAALFDENMVAVTVGDVSPVGIGVVYCATIEACWWLLDLGRAREWTDALSRWCRAQPDLVPFRGQCLVHRAELMRLGGAWSEALSEAERACDWPAASIDDAGDSPRHSSFKHPAGAAFYQLAEIHRLRGEFGNAEAAYRRANEYGHAPEPGLALLRLAQGKPTAAEATIRRVLGEPHARHRRAAVLAAGVEIMLAVADLPAALAAADELAAMAAQSDARYLRALAAHAAGAVRLTAGDVQGALTVLRQAWMVWQEIDAPWDAARARVLLGLACRLLGDDGSARLEFVAAERVFQRLGAGPDLTRLNALRAPLIATGEGRLTRREQQVLALIAKGMTNRAIASALAISDRTVDRHVSNILSKLDLPSRSAATAYAYERGLVQPRT